jgi:hypothetical protein
METLTALIPTIGIIITAIHTSLIHIDYFLLGLGR